jgi:O-antigen ligase
MSSPGFRGACVAAALLASSFVFLASRRMGMLAVVAWGALFGVLGRRFAGKGFFKLYMAGLAAAVLLLAVFWPRIEASFVGRRFRDAVDSMGRREGFIQDQFGDCVRTAPQWFPFGFGVGRGQKIDPNEIFEVHNGLLAVLVELGVLGFAGFAGMTALPLLRRRWTRRSEDHERLGVLLTTTLVISVLFMFHNTLYRDRTFLLLLGISTAVVRRESEEEPAPLFSGDGGMSSGVRRSPREMTP